MICNTIGLTADSFESIYTTGGTEVEEVYGAINYAQPIYAKIREMTGTSPLTFTSRTAGTLTDYRISGETLQDGTPSPDYPVDVVGCGVRTENLWDGTANVTEKIYEIEPNTSYTVGKYPPLGVQNGRINLVIYNSDMTQLWTDYAWVWLSTTSPNNLSTAKYAIVRIESGSPLTNFFFGKTGFDYNNYIPYGYKLPLTVNGTEYPIYLGQVPTTRRIKKLVLTGEEAWNRDAETGVFAMDVSNSLFTGDFQSGISSHWPFEKNKGVFGLLTEGHGCIRSAYNQLWIRDNNFPSVADFKSYLAAQYAAGTPVTVWYVLAEPETGIVNEPLMRIGEYADTISFSQAGVNIPIIAGANVLDMTSTVKPSEVYIKGKSIKPDGYGKLVDANGVYIFDKNGVQLTVHGQGTSN